MLAMVLSSDHFLNFFFFNHKHQWNLLGIPLSIKYKCKAYVKLKKLSRSQHLISGLFTKKSYVFWKSLLYIPK